MENSISKRIFYSWLGGGDKSQSVLECINSWKKAMPDYEIVELNEFDKTYFDFDFEYNNNKWFKTVYDLKLYAFVSDYARIKVLYNSGGVYFDTDVVTEKSFDELIKHNKLVLCWYNDEKIDGAVMVSPKHNKTLGKMLDFYNKGIWEEPEVILPEVVTKFLKQDYDLKSYKKTAEYDDCIILPPEYFYPMPVGFKDKDKFITNNTYAVHLWGGSWVKPEVLFFLNNKHLMKTEDIIEKCFKDKIIYKNPFITVKRRFSKYIFEIETHYALRFKYKKESYNKWLTIFILGKQFKLWKVKPESYICKLKEEIKG